MITFYLDLVLDCVFLIYKCPILSTVQLDILIAVVEFKVAFMFKGDEYTRQICFEDIVSFLLN